MALESELEDDDDDDEEEEGELFGLEAFMAAQSAKDVHERHLVFPRNIDNSISQPPFLSISFLSFSSSHFPPPPSLANEGLLIQIWKGGRYGFPSLPKTTPFGNIGLRCPCPSSSPSLRGGSAWVERFALSAKNFSIFSLLWRAEGAGGKGENSLAGGGRARGRERERREEEWMN